MVVAFNLFEDNGFTLLCVDHHRHLSLIPLLWRPFLLTPDEQLMTSHYSFNRKITLSGYLPFVRPFSREGIINRLSVGNTRSGGGLTSNLRAKGTLEHCGFRKKNLIWGGNKTGKSG